MLLPSSTRLPLTDAARACGREGGGLVGDGQAIYFTSGNVEIPEPLSPPSDFPATPRDEENSIIRLQLGDGGASVASYYDDRPYQSDGNVFQYTNRYDYDMSSSGAAWIPGTDDIVSGSKGGIVYLVSRVTMKQRQVPLSPFTVTALPAGQTLHIGPTEDGPEVLGAPLVWRRTGSLDDAMVYMWPRGDRLTALHYDHASTTMTVAASSTDVAGRSGASLSLSVNGADTGSALVWAYTSSGSGLGGDPAYVRAYDPITLKMLWQGNVPGFAKFVCPTIAYGRVFAVSWPSTGGADVVVFGTSACGG